MLSSAQVKRHEELGSGSTWASFTLQKLGTPYKVRTLEEANWLKEDLESDLQKVYHGMAKVRLIDADEYDKKLIEKEMLSGND